MKTEGHEKYIFIILTKSSCLLTWSVQIYRSILSRYKTQSLGSWREFGCRDDANAWIKSTKEVDKHKFFLLQFRK